VFHAQPDDRRGLFSGFAAERLLLAIRRHAAHNSRSRNAVPGQGRMAGGDCLFETFRALAGAKGLR
jgi:hypothetical protein